MSRIRTIKPEFWSDEKLSPLSPTTRLVFLGLISMSDDAGRLLDNLKQIDAFIFPETDDTAREHLATLSRIARIERGTTASGQKIIQIVNWGRHQRIDHPAKLGLIPPIVKDQQVTEARETLATTSRDVPEKLATLSVPVSSISTSTKEGERGSKPAPENLPEKLADTIPDGLHQLQYAQRLLEDLGLPAARSMVDLVGSAIASFAKQQQITKAESYGRMLARASEDQGKGTEINRFWFEDAKYGPNGVKRIATVKRLNPADEMMRQLQS